MPPALTQQQRRKISVSSIPESITREDPTTKCEWLHELRKGSYGSVYKAVWEPVFENTPRDLKSIVLECLKTHQKIHIQRHHNAHRLPTQKPTSTNVTTSGTLCQTLP